MTSSFLLYSHMVGTLREGQTILDDLRTRMARREIYPTAEMLSSIRNISIPRMRSSTNEIFFEPLVLPMNALVVCTLHVARGNGTFHVSAVDSSKVHVVNETSHTSNGGAALHIVQLLSENASIVVTFASSSESMVRRFHLQAKSSMASSCAQA